MLLTRPFESAQAILILFGAVIFVYGTGELVWSFKIRKLQQQQVVDSPRVVDAEYEEVEELHT